MTLMGDPCQPGGERQHLVNVTWGDGHIGDRIIMVGIIVKEQRINAYGKRGRTAGHLKIKRHAGRGCQAATGRLLEMRGQHRGRLVMFRDLAVAGRAFRGRRPGSLCLDSLHLVCVKDTAGFWATGLCSENRCFPLDRNQQL